MCLGMRAVLDIMHIVRCLARARAILYCGQRVQTAGAERWTDHNGGQNKKRVCL